MVSGLPAAVAQQRPPVHLRPGLAVAGRDRGGQLEALAHRHRRQPQPGGQPAKPGLFVAAGGQQHLAPVCWARSRKNAGELVLLGPGPGAGGAGREPGDRLDVVPHPQHRHLRQHLHAPGPGAGPGSVMACQWIPFASSSPAKQSPAVSEQPVQRQVMLEARTTAPRPGRPVIRVVQAAGGAGTSGRTPPRSRTSPPRRRRAAAPPAGCRRPGPGPGASRPGRRIPHPAAPAPRPTAPAAALSRFGGGELDQRRVPLLRARAG